MNFPTSYETILDRIDQVDPIEYARSRNYLDGAVSYLSPYISRGVISTRQVYEAILEKGFTWEEAEKFIQELAWRDYWQQVWIHRGDEIDQDLKSTQRDVSNREVPTAVVEAGTGIEVIDEAIEEFYRSGYLHNHLRMYVASLCCNMAKSHWLQAAKWMYFHLLDGDWASNALSWQWVAGTNSTKKYIANQENVNRFCHSEQKGTFLDTTYEKLAQISIPEAMVATNTPTLNTHFPSFPELQLDPSLPTLVYNYYNIDPNWKKDGSYNRILLLEPSVFNHYPVSEKCIQFALDLSQNISGMQYFKGEFDELKEQLSKEQIYFKEHPLNTNYQGIEEEREWMFSVRGEFPSFFRFWKACKKEVHSEVIENPKR